MTLSSSKKWKESSPITWQKEKKIAICWFRQDLRLGDNPALRKSVVSGWEVLPIYILDEVNSGERYRMGKASRWWLYHSLHLPIGGVFWNRCYEPWRRERDLKIEANVKKTGIACENFNGSLLWEPWNIHNNDSPPANALPFIIGIGVFSQFLLESVFQHRRR